MSAEPVGHDIALEKAAVLIDALPWLRVFHGKIVVVKYGGNAMTSPELQRAFAEDVVFLRYAGLRPVVVHGGGPQITAQFARQGLTSEFRAGLRVTTDEAMTVVRMVLTGQVNGDIVNLLNDHGPFAVGLSGEDGGLLTAEKRYATVDGRPVDLGQVGDVVGADPTVVYALLDAGKIPVIATVARGADQLFYNVNADTAAAAIAVGLGAEKLVMLTDVEGLYPDWPNSTEIVSEIGVEELVALLPRLSSGMLPKMEACVRAVRGGVPRAHVLDGRVPHALLLEIFTTGGIGTMVLPSSPQEVFVNDDLARRWDRVMMPNYGTPPLAIDRGEGVRVFDPDGTAYLDFVGGIAVSALGHAHPAVVRAVSEQVARVAHTSNLYLHEPGIALAERLVGLLGTPARVFFANSGSEANECAVKLARRHGAPRGRSEIVAAVGGFHGRTLGALSITGNPAKRIPFEPLPGPVRFVEYGDVTALRGAVGPQTAALFLEPALGEGGVVPAPAGYLQVARELCDRTGALFVVDEVQSGIGRTGHWFAALAEGVRPDVVTLAKGLGGGLPIGACIGIGAAGELFVPGDHGSTFGGNPVSCAAALAVIDTIETEHLLDSVKRVGEHLARGLDALTGPLVRGNRGVGLWRAVVLAGPAAAAVETAARARGLLVNAVKPDAVRLAPPLILTEADVDDALPRLQAALDDAAGAR